jgi:hypothetical protein
MITRELKSQIDKGWEAFWTGGIFNQIIELIKVINSSVVVL